MKARRFRDLWLAVLALALAHPNLALANPCRDDPGGMGGTGMSAPAPSGGGGDAVGATQALRTGHAETDPGGIGGTGLQAGKGDVGIVGVITGFASICANGMEIHYEHRTPIQTDRLSRRSLAIGQVVAVEASGVGSEVNARRIIVLHEISGPITSLDADARRIEVMGRVVDLGRINSFQDDSATGLPVTALKAGDFVRVSGWRRVDSGVEASHLMREESGTASVMGPLLRHAASNAFSVSGVPVELPTGSRVGEGQEVRVNGRWDGQALRVRVVTLDPVGRLLANLPRLELQGYATVDEANERIMLLGKTVQVHRGTRYIDGTLSLLRADQRKVLVSVQSSRDGKLVAERILFTKPSSEERASRNSGQSPSAGEIPGESRSAPETGTEPVDQGDPEGLERAGKADRTDATDTMENGQRPQKPEKVEKAEKAERPEKLEKPDKLEKPEKLEKPDKPLRPEKVERPAKPERMDKPEKPQRPEKPGRPFR